MENKNPKKQEVKPKEEYPINHRVRPEGMSITEAAVIGMQLAEKDPDYDVFIQSIKDFGNIEE